MAEEMGSARWWLRPLLVLLTTIAVPVPTAGSDTQSHYDWLPEKGDTIYIAVTLETLRLAWLNLWPQDARTQRYVLKACTPVIVTKIKPSKPRISLTGPHEVAFHLRKDWSTRLFKSHSECMQAHETLPVPKVTKSAWSDTGKHHFELHEPEQGLKEDHVED